MFHEHDVGLVVKREPHGVAPVGRLGHDAHAGGLQDVADHAAHEGIAVCDQDSHTGGRPAIAGRLRLVGAHEASFPIISGRDVPAVATPTRGTWELRGPAKKRNPVNRPPG